MLLPKYILRLLCLPEDITSSTLPLSFCTIGLFPTCYNFYHLKKNHTHDPILLLFSHEPTLIRLSLYCSAKMASNGLHIAKSCGQFSVFVLLDQKAASGINNTLLLLGILSSFCSQNTRLSWPLFPQWLLFSASFAA